MAMASLRYWTYLFRKKIKKFLFCDATFGHNENAYLAKELCDRNCVHVEQKVFAATCWHGG